MTDVASTTATEDFRADIRREGPPDTVQAEGLTTATGRVTFTSQPVAFYGSHQAYRALQVLGREAQENRRRLAVHAHDRFAVRARHADRGDVLHEVTSTRRPALRVGTTREALGLLANFAVSSTATRLRLFQDVIDYAHDAGSLAGLGSVFVSGLIEAAENSDDAYAAGVEAMGAIPGFGDSGGSVPVFDGTAASLSFLSGTDLSTVTDLVARASDGSAFASGFREQQWGGEGGDFDGGDDGSETGGTPAPDNGSTTQTPQPGQTDTGAGGAPASTPETSALTETGDFVKCVVGIAAGSVKGSEYAVRTGGGATAAGLAAARRIGAAIGVAVGVATCMTPGQHHKGDDNGGEGHPSWSTQSGTEDTGDDGDTLGAPIATGSSLFPSGPGMASFIHLDGTGSRFTLDALPQLGDDGLGLDTPGLLGLLGPGVDGLGQLSGTTTIPGLDPRVINPQFKRG